MNIDADYLFDVHGINVYDKQLCLAELIGDCKWSIDNTNGKIKFDDLSFSIQLIGSESNYDNTWLWIWANDISSFPENLLQSANFLKEYGEKHDIGFFTIDKYKLTDFDGHFVAMLSAGVCNSDCYYRAPYDGGAAYYLINGADEVKQIPETSTPTWIVNTFLDFISKYEVDHKLAIESYLKYKQIPFGYEDKNLKTSDGGLTVKFDKDGLVRRMQAKVEPSNSANAD